jgi:hypothetical protein
MRFGESYGEACRFCGSTEIVVWPPSSAGNCAHCSDAVKAWDARAGQLADRRLALARAAFDAAEADRRVAERAERWAARRAALRGAFARGGASTRAGIANLLRSLPRHTRASQQI